MVVERFTIVALPHSKAPDADFHVSLFVAPELTPDGDESRLDDFKWFPDWVTALEKHATIELFDQSGLIEATPLLDDLDAGAWVGVFPPDTPVRGPKRPDWTVRHWRTFDAAGVHDTGKALHLLALYTSPTSLPLPSAHPLQRFLAQWGGTRDQGWDESIVTRNFDRVLGEGDGEGGPPREIMSLASIEKNLASTDPLTKAFLELHRARRFYERPESKLKHQARPSPNPVVREVPRPEPDFHERCGLVADHPALQRRLGLVIDLEVADPARLASSKSLTATISLDEDASLSRSAPTSCRTVGDDLVTVATSADWHDGALRLGDTEAFAVLDMDPDGTALKLDRFIWALPRLAGIEANGDQVHAAPTALRSVGFTIARRQKALTTQERMDRQHQIAAAIGSGNPPLLGTEDVSRGMRVEVWDDVSEAWRSLHSRRITAEVHKGGVVADDLAEEGFVQGTTATETVEVEDSPVHVHEAMFGWDGWSLAAPRPGKRVRHVDAEEAAAIAEEAAENGDEELPDRFNEIVEDTEVDPDPVTPLVVTNGVEPGTLPRLRYGRSYAFRAWAVDLAGNTRPHEIGPVPSPDPATASAVSAILPTAPSTATPELVTVLRGAGAAQVIEARSRGREEVSDAVIDESIHGAVLGRLRERRGDGRLTQVDVGRGAAVDRAFGDILLAEDQPYVVGTAVFDPRVVLQPGFEFPTIEQVATVSPVRPFLRWDPVQPPVLVARHQLSAGESLRQVVVRSGVTQDRETLEITVTDPTAYAAEHAALGYRPDSERHLVPPKASQTEAELHGAFDRAIGSTAADRHKTMLAVALREAGTLFDDDVPRLTDPHIRDPQPGIALANDPRVPASVQKTLPLPAGEPPAPGQYVVHDTDELKVPYLPDFAARGISLVFPEAGRDRIIPFPFGTEGFTAAYRGTWPERRPFRLELVGSDVLEGKLTGGLLQVGLPPGDVQRFRLASSLRVADLDLFGLWRILPEILRTNPDIIEAAVDGWLWALTPFDEVTLVHAVPRPLEAPRPTALVSIRPAEGSIDVMFFGAVDVHGPSTEQLTAEASWEDDVDDLSLDGPSKLARGGVAFTTRIREEEDLAVLAPEPLPPNPPDVRVIVPGFGPVWVHGVRHQIGDTRHHDVDYRFRASTRFREYFDASAMVPAPPDPELPVDDGQSVVGPLTGLNVLSSARPAAPIVRSVLPLFRWDDGTEPEQPVAYRRRRRAGARIYLERPWYSSGSGELLGVLVAPGGNDLGLESVVSQWGADPVWVGQEVPNRAMLLELDNLMRTFGLDDRPGDAMPVLPPANFPLAALPKSPQVLVLGYQPQYNAERQLWYVDVAIDPGSRMWPFVRLSVARFQPDSIAGCHLSAPVLCDFVQLTPERTASVSRTDVRHIRVVVSGPAGVRDMPTSPHIDPGIFPRNTAELADWVGVNRVMLARLQRADPGIPTDLGWETVDVVELEVKGIGRNIFEPAWVGSLEAPVNIPLRRPGDQSKWRVAIEEWERLPGDPADLGFIGLFNPRPVWEERLIYADFIGL